MGVRRVGLVQMLQDVVQTQEDGEVRIVSLDAVSSWECRIEQVREDESVGEEAAQSTSISVAKLAAREMGGELTILSEVGHEGWRLRIPWAVDQS